MRKKELKKRVYDKLLECYVQQQGDLTEAFIEMAREINKMERVGLEQMNKELLHVLHEEKTIGIPRRTH